MKVKDFFNHRTDYCPIIVETINSGFNVETIYSEENTFYKDKKEVEKFLNIWGGETVFNWSIVGGSNSEESYMLLRIKIV